MTSQSRPDLRTIAGWLTVFVPIAIALGNVASEATVAAIAVLFLAHSIQQRDFGWARSPWTLCALALWGWSIARNLFLDTSLDSLGVSLAWVRFVVFAAAISTWILPEPVWRRRLLVAGTAAVGFMALDALLQYAVGRDIIGRRIINDRLTAEFPRPMVGIEIAWLVFPLLMGLVSEARPRLAAAFAAVCAAAIFLSGERLAFLLTLGYFAAAMLNFALLRRIAIWAVPALAVVLLAAFVFAHGMFQRQVTSTIGVVTDFSDTHYGILWNSALKIAEDHPLLGVGMHRYRVVCHYAKYGPENVGPKGLPRCDNHPHNIFIEWLTETGAIGLAGFLAFAGVLLWQLGRGFWADRSRLVYFGLFVTLALRFWPLASTTSFFIAWSAVPLWLLIGWASALASEPQGSEKPPHG